MKITIIDGQGGRIGRTVIEQLKKKHEHLELYAIGTNSAATAAMLKAGADYGATGDNALIVNAADSDLIVGPVGIASPTPSSERSHLLPPPLSAPAEPSKS